MHLFLPAYVCAHIETVNHQPITIHTFAVDLVADVTLWCSAGGPTLVRF